LLRGLTAEDDSATSLLQTAGVSPESVHRSVGNRLSTGASQAADRLAWTPHSREAIAIVIVIAEARPEQNGSDRLDRLDRDDLRIGLTRVGRGAAAEVLTEVGCDPAALAVTPADA
jgi:hypothetical protein